jgi:hypothetical protein
LLARDQVVRAAAVFGLTFRCDPFAVLDRPVGDLPVVLALVDAAAAEIKKQKT